MVYDPALEPPVSYNQSHMYSHEYQKYLQNTDKILKTKAVISSSHWKPYKTWGKLSQLKYSADHRGLYASL